MIRTPCPAPSHGVTTYGVTAGLRALSSAWPQAHVPDHERTPGAINPEVTQDTLQQTACAPGWTKTIRPPSSYTTKLRKQQIREIGLPGDTEDYYEDHLVPLCMGGHPRDPRNLWPQPLVGKWTDKIKGQLEGSVCRAVCRGDMTLEQGRAIFLVRPNGVSRGRQAGH
jgi:hypothetical protein